MGENCWAGCCWCCCCCGGGAARLDFPNDREFFAEIVLGYGGQRDKGVARKGRRSQLVNWQTRHVEIRDHSLLTADTDQLTHVEWCRSCHAVTLPAARPL